MFIPSSIKSIQRFTIVYVAPSPTVTQAIAAVDPNYTELNVISNGVIGNNGGDASGSFLTAELTSGVLITCTVGDGSFAGGISMTVEVVERYPAYFKQPVQRGTISIIGASVTQADQLITAVGAKAQVRMCGWRSDLNSGSGTLREAIPILAYLDSTHIRANRFNNGVVDTTVISYEVSDVR